ncbi:45759_t:CDS:2, partial [Gigaspora margarita]
EIINFKEYEFRTIIILEKFAKNKFRNYFVSSYTHNIPTISSLTYLGDLILLKELSLTRMIMELCFICLIGSIAYSQQLTTVDL